MKKISKKMTILIKNISFSIIDIETTGLNPKSGHRICEIGILKIKDSRIEGSFHSLINPCMPIPQQVSLINGITDDMVKEAPLFGEVVCEIMPLIKNSTLVCHNAAFDMSFISTQIKELHLPPLENSVIDTLIIARKFFNFPSNKLGSIARFLNLNHKNKHRAMGDVIVTKKIFEYFIKELNITTLDDLLKIGGVRRG